jgi:hypothetical protein
MEKIIDYAKKIEQRNIGMEKQPKVSKIIARRKRTNQDGDENEERRSRTDEDTHGI